MTTKEEAFEIWWKKLQVNDSLAAWLIGASLPYGIAKQIYFDATNEQQKEIDEMKEAFEISSDVIGQHEKEEIKLDKDIEYLKAKYEKAVTCLIVLKQILSSGDFDIVAIRNRINDLLKELE